MHLCPRCHRLLKAIGVGALVCAYCIPLFLGEHDPAPDRSQAAQMQDAILPAGHDDEPAKIPEEARTITAVAAVSGAAAAVPFGWNMTTQELPPASRRQAFAAVMTPFSDNGWLVRREQSNDLTS